MIDFMIENFVEFVNSFFQAPIFSELQTDLQNIDQIALSYSGQLRSVLTDVSYFVPLETLFTLCIVSLIIIIVRIVLAVIDLIWW